MRGQGGGGGGQGHGGDRGAGHSGTEWLPTTEQSRSGECQKLGTVNSPKKRSGGGGGGGLYTSN